MPERKTIERAKKDKREGKSASTQAGEYVKEQIEHIRQGKHGARSARQAVAIGLSEARRAGVALSAPKAGSSAATRKKAAADSDAGHGKPHRPTDADSHAKRSASTTRALKREGQASASTNALSKQAHTAASRRTASERSSAARKASETKGASGRSAAAKKAAQTRARHH